MMQQYQILVKKLPKHFDRYIIGKLLTPLLYIYRMSDTQKHKLFAGSADEVLDKLVDEEFLKDVERKITKDGKSTSTEA